MTVYKTIEAENALSYTELKVPLDQQGLVLIDGKVGSGKSSIFDILTHVLYGTTSKDGVSANGILNRYVVDKSGKPYGYAARARFSNLGHEYLVEQYRSHPEKGTGIEFFEDEKSIKEKSNRSENLDTQKLVAKKLGMSLREFYGGVYLPQNHTHDLVVGKPKARQEYLLRYFGIDLFDRLIPEAKSRAASSADGADTSVFDAKIATLDAEAAQYGALASLQEQAAAAQNLVTELETSLETREQQVSQFRIQHDRWVTYAASLKRVQEHACAGLALEKAQQELDILRMQLQRLQDQQAAIQKSEGLRSLLAMEAKVDDVDSARQSMADLKAVIAAYEKDQPKRQKIEALRASVTDDIAWSPELEKKLSAARTRLTGPILTAASLKLEIDKLEKLGDKCFTCLRPVSSEECASLLEERQSLLAATDKVVQKEQGTVQLLEMMRDSAANNARILEQVATLESALLGSPADLQLAEAKNRVVQLSSSIASHERYVDIEAKLVKLGVDAVIDDIEAKELRDRWSARVRLLAEYVGLIASCGDAPERVDEAVVNAAVSLLAAVKEKLYAARDSLTRIAYSVSVLQRIESQRSKIVEERSAVADKIRRHRVLQTLHISLKDLRSIKLHDAAQLLVSVLPLYLKEMFLGEDIQVSVEDTEDSCDLVFSKNGTWIPLEGLSGGQQRALGLSLLFTFTQIANRNSNILVLDEPYTNLDAPSRAACYDILRDLLGPDRRNKNLTSLFVMSHEQDLKSQWFDQRWVVEYNGSTSRLVIP